MPQLAFGAAAAAASAGISGLLASAGPTAILSSMVASAALAAVTGAISMAMAPDAPDKLPPNTSLRQPIPAAQIPYGQTRVGGKLALFERGDSHEPERLHIVCVVAACKINGFLKIYDGDKLLWDAQNGIAPEYQDKVATLKMRNGDDDQSAVTALTDNLDSVDSTFRLRGCAYFYIKLNNIAKHWARGLPRLWAEIEGCADIYDPRDGSTGYTDNWSLVVADYLTRDRGGAGFDWAELDEQSVKDAANVSDESVALSGGGTQARYTVNGTVRGDALPGDALNALMVYGAGQVVDSDGTFTLIAGAYEAPVATIEEQHFTRPIEVSPAVKFENLVDGVRGTYSNPDALYQPDDFGALLFSDYGGTAANARWLDLDLRRSTDAERAQRLAIIAGKQRRRHTALTCGVFASFLALEAGDAATIKHPDLGLDNVFEIQRTTLNLSPEGTDLGIEALIDDPSYWSWDENDATAAPSVKTPRIPNSSVIDPPSNLQVSQESEQLADGTTVPIVLIEWDATPTDWAKGYIVRFTNDKGRVGERFTEETSLEVRGYAGKLDISVVAVNWRMMESAAITYQNASEAQDTTPPPVPVWSAGQTSDGVERAIVVKGETVVIRWENPATDGSGDPVRDLKHTEVWRSTSSSLTLDGNGNPTNAELLGVSAGTYFTDNRADPESAYWYFLRAVDWSDNASSFDSGRRADTGTSAIYGAELSVDDPLITYDENGANPSPASVTFTAEASGFADPYFEFLVWNGSSYQQERSPTTSPTFSRAAPSALSSMPLLVRVDVREGSSSSGVLASKKLAIAGTGAGIDGVSTYTAVIWKRASSAPSTPSGGSYDFGANSLTPPTGWSAEPPSGADPLYSSSVTFSVVGQTGTDTAGTWSAPQKTVEDGQAGKSTYQATIYRRSASQPASPSGGSFDFGANSLTPPSGWSEGVPADDGNPVWVCRYLFSVSGDTGTDTAGAWSSTSKLAEDGQDGSDGLSTAVVHCYQRAASRPSTPSGGFYNFDNNSLSPPSGWSDEIPADDGSPAWASSATASIQGTSGYDTSLSWSTPRELVSSGTDGDAGPRGPGRWNIGVTSLPTSSSEADTEFRAAIGAPRDDDQAFFYEGSESAPTAQGVWIYDAGTSSWNEQEEVVRGDLLVEGTVTASRFRTADFANLVPDNFITEASEWAPISGDSWVIHTDTTKDGYSSKGVWTNDLDDTSQTTGARLLTSKLFKVEPSAEYWFSFDYELEGTSPEMTASAFLRTFDKDGNSLSNRGQIYFSESGVTGRKRVEGLAVMPDNALYADLRFRVESYDPYAGQLTVGSPNVFRSAPPNTVTEPSSAFTSTAITDLGDAWETAQSFAYERRRSDPTIILAKFSVDLVSFAGLSDDYAVDYRVVFDDGTTETQLGAIVTVYPTSAFSLFDVTFPYENTVNLPVNESGTLKIQIRRASTNSETGIDIANAYLYVLGDKA